MASSSLHSFASQLLSGCFRNIVVVSGAGVSTNAGIPDYRSPMGILKHFQHKHNLTSPEDIFTTKYSSVLKDDEDYISFLSDMQNAEPQPSHLLPKFLDEKGWLRRVYTQNIDGLYLKTGIDRSKVIEFHGSLRDGNVVLSFRLPKL